jgi:hypothetical protein
MMMASKAERRAHAFPSAAVDSLLNLADQRLELLAVWVLALVAGIVLLVRALRSAAAPPITLALVVSVTCLHLAALTVMAEGGPDAYTIYSYATLSVLFALLVAWTVAQAASRWGGRGGVWVGAAAVALTVILYRPDAVTAGMATVSALWRDRAGAVCSWRFAEGFLREHRYGGAVPGQTGEEHAIERCRSLSEPAQVVDCVGGLARELHWRRGGTVHGNPPDGLSAVERDAYAYHYGTHRFGDGSACTHFVSAELAEDCAAAVQLECLVFADLATRYGSASGLPRPGCRIPEPPMEGYWSAMRAALLARPRGALPALPAVSGDADLAACRRIVEGCY